MTDNNQRSDGVQVWTPQGARKLFSPKEWDDVLTLTYKAMIAAIRRGGVLTITPKALTLKDSKGRKSQIEAKKIDIYKAFHLIMSRDMLVYRQLHLLEETGQKKTYKIIQNSSIVFDITPKTE